MVTYHDDDTSDTADDSRDPIFLREMGLHDASDGVLLVRGGQGGVHGARALLEKTWR